VADGMVRLGSEPGLGVRLVDNLAGRPGVSQRVTRLGD
jgi:hypothetical protein